MHSAKAFSLLLILLKTHNLAVRQTCMNSSRWNISRHHTSSTNNCLLANFKIRQNCNSATDNRALPDLWGCKHSTSGILVIKKRRIRRNEDLVFYYAFVADCNVRLKTTARTDHHVFANVAEAPDHRTSANLGSIADYNEIPYSNVSPKLNILS